MALPHFLGPKVLIIFFDCRPLFLAWSIFVMNVLVVPVDAYQARPALSAPRHNWSDEYIKTVTDWARQHGIAGAVQRHQRHCAASWQGKVTQQRDRGLRGGGVIKA